MVSYSQTRERKAKARKRGPSLLRKTSELGQEADIPTLTLYECPTHKEWRIRFHLPRGRKFPDVNRLLNDASLEPAAKTTSQQLATQTQPSYVPKQPNGENTPIYLPNLNNNQWSVSTPNSLAMRNLAPYAGERADEETAPSIQRNDDLGRPISAIWANYPSAASEAGEWGLCLPSQFATSSCAGASGATNVYPLADAEIVLEAASASFSREEEGEDPWPPSNSVTKPDDRSMGQPGATGVADVVTGNINDKLPPADSMSIDLLDGTLMDKETIRTDSIAALLPETLKATTTTTTIESDVEVESEVEVALPSYRVWMRLARGSWAGFEHVATPNPS